MTIQMDEFSKQVYATWEDVQRRKQSALNEYFRKLKANSESTEAESEKIISNQSKDKK